MSYDEDEGFGGGGFKMSDYDDEDETFTNDELLDDYEEEDPDSRYT